jgi:hypothetical protein
MILIVKKNNIVLHHGATLHKQMRDEKRILAHRTTGWLLEEAMKMHYITRSDALQDSDIAFYKLVIPQLKLAVGTSKLCLMLSTESKRQQCIAGLIGRGFG